MAVTRPKWLNASGAVPTKKGWMDPKSGEVLKKQKFTDAEIAEWNGAAPAPKKQMLHEAPVDTVEDVSTSTFSHFWSKDD